MDSPEVLNQATPPDDVIEHAMRLTDSEVLVISFLSDRPDRRVCVGALLASRDAADLPAGTPLRAWAFSTPLAPSWRELVPSLPGSLWDRYESLRELCGPVQAPNPYEALCALTDLADERLGSA